MHQRQWVAHRPAYSCAPRCCSGSTPSAASLPQVCPAIEELVTQLEGCWRSVLPEDQFGLYELDEASVLLLYCCTGTVVAHCTCTAALRPPRCRNAPGSPLFPCFPHCFPAPRLKRVLRPAPRTVPRTACSASSTSTHSTLRAKTPLPSARSETQPRASQASHACRWALCCVGRVMALSPWLLLGLPPAGSLRVCWRCRMVLW